MLQPRSRLHFRSFAPTGSYFFVFTVVDSYEAAQERESLRLLRYTLDKPEESYLNAKRYSASIVYTLTYGKDLDDDGGDDLSAILDIVEGFIQDCYPGAHLVDTFPLLDFLPDILAPWRKQAFKKHDFEMKVSLLVPYFGSFTLKLPNVQLAVQSFGP